MWGACLPPPITKVAHVAFDGPAVARVERVRTSLKGRPLPRLLCSTASLAKRYSIGLPAQGVRRAKAGDEREASVIEFMRDDQCLVMTYTSMVYAQKDLFLEARCDDKYISLAIFVDAHVPNQASVVVPAAGRRLCTDKRLLLSATPSGGILDLHHFIAI